MDKFDISGSRGRVFLTIKETAEELRVSERSVWRWVEDGALPVHKFCSSTRVSQKDLNDYINRSKRAGQPDDEENS